MNGHIYIIFCIPMVIQSRLLTITDRIKPQDIPSSTEQSKCYIKFYKRRTKYAYPLFWLPSNQFTRFFIYTLLCVAMVTMFAMHIIQKLCLCVADCKLGYTNKILFTYIAFDCLILTS